MANEPIILSVPGHAELRLSTTSGRVTLTAEERSDIEITSGAPDREKIESDATGLIALTSKRGGSATLEVRCPIGTDVAIGTISGSAHLIGNVGQVRVTTVSGDVNVAHAETLDARSVSGNIEVDHCSGRCRLQTKSGRVTCRLSGDTAVSTVSGRVQLDSGTGKIRVQSASGKVQLCTQGNGDVTVRTLSGSVKVEVPQSVRPNIHLRSMSRKPRCECEEGNDCEIKVQSLSGKIEVVPV